MKVELRRVNYPFFDYSEVKENLGYPGRYSHTVERFEFVSKTTPYIDREQKGYLISYYKGDPIFVPRGY